MNSSKSFDLGLKVVSQNEKVCLSYQSCPIRRCLAVINGKWSIPPSQMISSIDVTLNKNQEITCEITLKIKLESLKQTLVHMTNDNKIA